MNLINKSFNKFKIKFAFCGNRYFSQSPFKNVTLGPKDSIFGLLEEFMADSDPKKVNLSIGAYRDEEGNPWILPVVKKVEKEVISKNTNMSYLPIIGSPKFIKASIDLVYGSKSIPLKENRIAAIQTLSGTGALSTCFDFLKKFVRNDDNKSPIVYLSDPTYANHVPILTSSRFQTTKYRYYNSETNGLDLTGLLADLEKAPINSIVLLHAVAHNPTGVDPKPEDWIKISKVCKEKKLIPVFDFAYQGFASGDVDADAVGVRQFVEDGHQVLVCQSFAKNFGLYGHRVGCLSIIASDIEEKQKIESQLKIIARTHYSNPPIHGSRIVETILEDKNLTNEWKKEVKMMADRIIGLRQTLKNSLVNRGSSLNWDHVTNQIGMFCFTGLTPDQVSKLASEWHVYMTKNGRISLAGINSKNVEYIAESFHAVTQ